MTLDKLNFDEALRYMGCKKDIADDRIIDMLNNAEELLLSACIPRYCYNSFDIAECDSGIEVKGTNLVLTGEDIKRHLKDCFGVVIMCATLSGKTDLLIRKTQLEDMSLALAVNSLASVAIEQVCDKVEDEIHAKSPQYYKTWRYSPGYGDLPITLQKDILNILNAPRRIGLCINDSMLLTPVKSVTAIIGLSHSPVAPAKRGCLCCNLKNTCQYRKVGNHCVQ